MASEKTIKSVMESMLFVWGEPLEAKAVAEVLNIETKEAIKYMQELAAQYEDEERGIRIREINKTFQLTSYSENSEYIERLCTPVRKRRLSQSALEVLAIVAYKQPVTRGEIEAVRGIKCDRVLEGLEAKELVCQVGRSDGIGRPILFGTTDEFLRYFGYESLKELPEIEDIANALDAEVEEELPGQINIDQLIIDTEGQNKE